MPEMLVHYSTYIDTFNLPVAHFHSIDHHHADSWLIDGLQCQFDCTFPYRMFGEIPDICEHKDSLLRNTSYKELLKPMVMEPHFDANSTKFNYPMIPFCWFGAPHKWIGEVDVYQYRNDIAGYYNMLKWCNVFKPSMPLRKQCYSVNDDLTSKKSVRIGSLIQY